MLIQSWKTHDKFSDQFQERRFFATVTFFVCSLSAMQIILSFHFKKILFSTFNRSKIFQIVFEIYQIYEKSKPKKMHQIWLKSLFSEFLSQIWNILLGVILVNLLYLKNYLEYFRSVWSAKKFFFQMKYWNICMA